MKSKLNKITIAFCLFCQKYFKVCCLVAAINEKNNFTFVHHNCSRSSYSGKLVKSTKHFESSGRLGNSGKLKKSIFKKIQKINKSIINDEYRDYIFYEIKDK